MTYRSAVFGFEKYGVRSHPEPTIYCDGPGCSERMPVRRGNSDIPWAWFLDGKAAPGWTVSNPHGGTARIDLCPKCKHTDGSVPPAESKGEAK